jgi:hypothetical protein
MPSHPLCASPMRRLHVRWRALPLPPLFPPCSGSCHQLESDQFLIGRGSLGGSRCLYKSTRSAVCFTIVWGHGRVVVSDAALYHPFRWQKDSWTFPPASSASIILPTRAVRALRSPQSASHIFCCKRRPPVWQSLPVLRSMLRWLIRRHVSAGSIHSLPCCGGQL